MKKYLLLFLILVLAAAVRFYRLGDYPALNADEAAIGYNAYSLIQTGRDEHGNPWPVHFQSFNDFKPGLYFYLVLPFVKVLGLNEWAVRIPGAGLGILTVLVLYFLVRDLFAEEKLALAASFLLAISPWHIHFSRGGWEVNVATFFITLGIWLFLRFVKWGKFSALRFSVLSFVLSLYTYHSARLIVPLLGLILLVIHADVLRKNLRQMVPAAVLGLILLTPLILSLRSPALTSRAAGVSIFSDSGPLNRVNEQRGEHGELSSLTAKLLHNKPVNYGLVFLSNWAKHYDGEFLFNSGDAIQRNKVPDMGLMYLFEVATVVVGFICLCRDIKKWRIILGWILIAPLAAALTFQSPHALRAENMVVPLTVVSAFGLVNILALIGKFAKVRTLVYVLIVLLISWSFVRYLHLYWVHMAREYPFSSQYGVKELVRYLQRNGDKYAKIIVTDRYDQPYILFLFYMKYPAKDFQADHKLTGRDRFGFSTVDHFGKFYFRSIDLGRETADNPKSLIAGAPEEIETGNVIETIYGSNNYPYFRVVEN